MGLLDGGEKVAGSQVGGEESKPGGGGGWGEKKAKEWLEFLPPDAASLRSSEPSSYVYRALGRGRGGSERSGPSPPILGGDSSRKEEGHRGGRTGWGSG